MRRIQHTASMNRRLSWAGRPLLPSPPGQMRPQPLPNDINHVVAPVRCRHAPHLPHSPYFTQFTILSLF